MNLIADKALSAMILLCQPVPPCMVVFSGPPVMLSSVGQGDRRSHHVKIITTPSRINLSPATGPSRTFARFRGGAAIDSLKYGLGRDLRRYLLRERLNLLYGLGVQGVDAANRDRPGYRIRGDRDCLAVR